MNALVIGNPRAARYRRDSVQRAVAALKKAGWEVDLRETSAPGDATELAREAVDRGLETVVVAGGDGTLNESVQALAGRDTALGFLPYGTVNVWARELGIPLEGEEASRSITAGETRSMDLGVANGRYFLLMAGIGFDSLVVERARKLERHKGRVGILPYVAAGLMTAPTYFGEDLEIRYDGLIRKVRSLMLVAGNTRLYGNRFHFTPNAIADDGLLDVSIVKGNSPLDLARKALPLLTVGRIRGAGVEQLRVSELSVDADVPLPFQLDGELCGTTPLKLGVAAGALRVIVPAGRQSVLMQN